MKHAAVNSNALVELVFNEHKEYNDDGELVNTEPPTQPRDLTTVTVQEMPDGWQDALVDDRLKMPDIDDPSSITIERK